MSKLFGKNSSKRGRAEAQNQQDQQDQKTESQNGQAPSAADAVSAAAVSADAVSAAAVSATSNSQSEHIDGRLVAILSAAIAAFEGESGLPYKITSIIPVQTDFARENIGFNTPVWGRAERLAQRVLPYSGTRSSGGKKV